MAEYVTKNEIEGLLSEQTKVILGAMDERFQKVDERFQKVDERFQKMDARFEGVERELYVIRQRMDEFDKKMDRLATTLDNFLKRLTDHEDEFVILKSEVDQIKMILKEKLGVEILVQGR